MHKIHLNPIQARSIDILQNLARFYVYDLARYCGKEEKGWAIEKTGLYESFDFSNYIHEENRKAYFVEINREFAGFVLLNQSTRAHSHFVGNCYCKFVH